MSNHHHFSNLHFYQPSTFFKNLSFPIIRPNETERQTVRELIPTLQQGFVEMIGEARKEKAFQRKYNRFDPVDFLARYLYNSKRTDCEKALNLLEIPFVQKFLSENPRKELPLRQRLTDDEAVLIIQKSYRGYRVRKDNEVQELRNWQDNYRQQVDVEDKNEICESENCEN